MAEGNKNQWVIWAIVVGAIIITFIAFNYQGDKTEVVPLSEIFPDADLDPSSIVEYEFVVDDNSGVDALPPAEQKAPAVAAAQDSLIPQVPPKSPKPTKKSYYTIQALSSKNKQSTEKALAKAKAAGFSDAFMVTQGLEGKGTWHRIYIGQFDSKEQADARLSKAREAYNDCFIKYIK